ncbi:hypothetical protein [Actinacidiphila acididurans]|uniref:Uncharacterized protein n=1 Tax=Actinacidiphila acididurans TaxID=2784346 RepID=A0ABS2U4A9_9ACTN|nr:hypothetical protein [Actinacidiphila acididurans]MBM9509986.1 hypothetical protein [Actinacidiphila acididurans]
MALPANLELLFGESHEAPKLSKAEVSERFDELVKSIGGMPERELTREEIVTSFKAGQPVDFTSQPTNALGYLEKALGAPDLVKGLGADAVASITQALDGLKAQTPDLVKDINLTSPVGTGLVAFDLEAPAKLLAPRPTPLRNRIPRIKGIGTSHRFKVISGFTGSGTGGVGNIHPGIQDTTQNNFAPSGAGNSLYYARGPKIAYAGYDVTLPYSQFSMSDEVTWSAQYAGQGYQDIRQLSRTSLLYASMLMEERMILMGRGTASPYSGALAAPGGVSLVDNTVGTGQVALTGYTTNIYVYVTSDAGAFGESVVSSVATIAPTSTHNVVLRLTDVPQALGYNVYIGTGASQPANSSFFLYGRFPNQTANGGGAGGTGIVLQGAIPTSGKNPPTADTSAYAAGYDGILPWVMGTQSGYNVKINSTFSTSNPGSEFQTAFAALYNAVKADPDRILFNGVDRKQQSDTLKAGSSNNYFLQITQDQVSGVSLGSVAVAIMNEVTGKRVEMEVHPWLPQGVCPILSDTLPIPDTQVSNVWSMINVQDLMGIDWPVNQFAYESSSYWFGGMLCYAPAWNGCISGVTAA